MSNLKVRPKQVDFSKMNIDYAKAEICIRVPIEKMKNELIHHMYTDFKDDSQTYMRHLDIVKKEHKLKDFDTLSPNGESKLLLYLGVYLNTWSTNEIKNTYINKVFTGDIPYYE